MNQIRFFLLGLICLPAILHAQRTVSPTKTVNVNKNFQQTEGSYADVNGIKMYYEEYGEGDPVLIIPGNGDSIHSVLQQVQFLSKRFHVIIADSRGTGKSMNSADSLTFEKLSSDYYNLLETLQLDSVMILGFNDGAVIALMLAMDHPEKVKRLITMSARLWTDTSSVQQDILSERIKMRKADIDSIKAGNASYKSDLMRQHLFLYHPDINIEDLQLIEIPVLVLCGDRDMVKLEHTILLYQSLGNAELCIFPGTTENAATESAQLFNNQVMKFFMKNRNKAEQIDN